MVGRRLSIPLPTIANQIQNPKIPARATLQSGCLSGGMAWNCHLGLQKYIKAISNNDNGCILIINNA